MAKSTTGSRLRLGEPLATDFAAFRAAFYNAPEIEIIREALQQHIDQILANEPERQKRFETEKKRIMAERAPNLTLLHSKED